VVEVISNTEEASGVVVPKPTWAIPVKLAAIKAALNNSFFII
jgi:hypothetical protein